MLHVECVQPAKASILFEEAFDKQSLARILLELGIAILVSMLEMSQAEYFQIRVLR